MARTSTGRTQAARSRSLRTLQHQRLSPRIRHAIDTEVWIRGLLLARSGATSVQWATKDAVHDEALERFLQRHLREPPSDYPARRVDDEDVTFWIDSRLMERARRMAERDGVRVARLIDAALSAYVRERIPAEWLAFRERVQQEARRLYGADAPGGRRATEPPTRKTGRII